MTWTKSDENKKTSTKSELDYMSIFLLHNSRQEETAINMHNIVPYRFIFIPFSLTIVQIPHESSQDRKPFIDKRWEKRIFITTKVTFPSSITVIIKH